MTMTKNKATIGSNNFHHFFNSSLENFAYETSHLNVFDLFDYPVIIRRDDKFIFNHFAQSLFGYMNHELNEERNKDVIQFNSLLKQNAQSKGKITITRKDKRKYKFSSLHIINRDVEAWLLYREDDNSILEENISDRSKILSMIYENTSDAMALINVDNDSGFSILSVNQTFVNVSGITKEKCIGNKVEDVFPANILKLIKSPIRWVTINRRQIIQEVNIILKDESFNFDSSLIPILNKSGRCVFILLVAHNITERKKKEDELLKAKNEAEESSRLKATLLANMSHEVRTPLTAILGFAELLEEELVNKEQLALAQNIRSGGKRLLYTLNSIIELSRLEAEKIDIYKKNLDIKDTLGQLMQRFKPEAEAKGLSMVLEINIHEKTLHLDASLFNQIMINLLDNAIKFTKQGGIKIVIEKETEDLKSFVVIKVIDTGIGISKNNLKNIFNDFKQESEGWGRSHEGIGLGLSLVKRMTELMSGSVSVQSEKHKGSTFMLRFPTMAETYLEHSLPNNIDSSKRKLRVTSGEIPSVLLVEDNELNITLTKMYLKNNYSVDHATDGNSALKKINEKIYDAVLMDINLGDGMNGVDALNELKKNVNYKNVPVIAITGYAIGTDEKNLLDCGFKSYLSKPFEKSQLLNLLNETICRK